MRSKKALINTIVAVLQEVVGVICGLILPRLILSAFGSSYNGITSSITQFLACVSLLRGGVGAVTRAALFKPLADNNSTEISTIMNATERFMRKVATIFAIGLVGFACVYPLLVSYEFEWLFSFTLVLILGISTFMEYYFGITNLFLLQADQKQYIISIVQMISTVLNTLFAFILINLGCGIHLVKLGSAIAFSINPLLRYFYVRKRYKIDKKVAPDLDKIKQRWDAFWQTVAYFVNSNCPIMILTFFANIKEVSVYTVYHYVIANIRNIVNTFITGFGAAFGNMLAKGEDELARKNFRVFELVIFNLVSIVYTTAGVMVLPFVSIYTNGITDVEYIRPIFAVISTLGGAFACFRIPYQSIVEAAGHFKQTRNGAFVEAVLNIGISVICVVKFGLIGVAIGTLVAGVIRSSEYAIYVSKHIIKRSQLIFFAHIVVTAIIAVLTALISDYLFAFETPNYFYWAVKSVLVVLTSGALTLIADFALYKKETLYMIEKAKNLVNKKKEKNRA